MSLGDAQRAPSNMGAQKTDVTTPPCEGGRTWEEEDDPAPPCPAEPAAAAAATEAEADTGCRTARIGRE